MAYSRWPSGTSENPVLGTERPRGGHFAALEQPALLVQDVRSFFGKLRRQGTE